MCLSIWLYGIGSVALSEKVLPLEFIVFEGFLAVSVTLVPNPCRAVNTCLGPVVGPYGEEMGPCLVIKYFLDVGGGFAPTG
jgi:hypothetical protein